MQMTFLDLVTSAADGLAGADPDGTAVRRALRLAAHAGTARSGGTDADWAFYSVAMADAVRELEADLGDLMFVAGLPRQVPQTEQLRVDGAWRDTRAWLSTQTRPVWRDGAVQLLARLPDLADVLRRAVQHARERGTIVAPTGQLRPQKGKLVSTPVWAPVPPGHESYQTLRNALAGAADASRELAIAAGVPDRPGLAAADAAAAIDRQQAPHPAHLAAQWYPQGESPTTSGRSPRSERSRPRYPHQPPPSRSQ